MKPTLADEIQMALASIPYREGLPLLSPVEFAAVDAILCADWPKPPAPVLSLRFILDHAVEVVR